MREITRLPLARTENLVVRKLDDETLVYDMERDQAHCLNRTAAMVWNHCNGRATARQVARAMGKELDAPVDADLIWLAVKQLERFHLVQKVENGPSVSRRDLVLKYAPAIFTLPVIMSIEAPTPAQSASCVCPTCCPGFTCVGGSSCRPT